MGLENNGCGVQEQILVLYGLIRLSRCQNPSFFTLLSQPHKDSELSPKCLERCQEIRVHPKTAEEQMRQPLNIWVNTGDGDFTYEARGFGSGPLPEPCTGEEWVAAS